MPLGFRAASLATPRGRGNAAVWRDDVFNKRLFFQLKILSVPQIVFTRALLSLLLLLLLLFSLFFLLLALLLFVLSASLLAAIIC